MFVFIIRFGGLPLGMSLWQFMWEFLVFFPMGLVSAIVLIVLVQRAKRRNRRISTVAGYLLATPCASIGALFSGLLFPHVVGPLLDGTPPLILGAGLGYLLGRPWDA